MAAKLIDATAAKPGTTILLDGEPFSVKSNDISKSGKHGASKCRIEAKSVFTGKKRIVAVPGSQRFEVPMVEKRRGQILSVSGESASVMDMESYETLELSFQEEIGDQLAAEKQVEYWVIEGQKSIMRVI
jgi:translation initiation factor 5A